jgi:hypothetical protein
LHTEKFYKQIADRQFLIVIVTSIETIKGTIVHIMLGGAALDHIIDVVGLLAEGRKDLKS